MKMKEEHLFISLAVVFVVMIDRVQSSSFDTDTEDSDIDIDTYIQRQCRWGEPCSNISEFCWERIWAALLSCVVHTYTYTPYMERAVKATRLGENVMTPHKRSCVRSAMTVAHKTMGLCPCMERYKESIEPKGRCDAEFKCYMAKIVTSCMCGQYMKGCFKPGFMKSEIYNINGIDMENFCPNPYTQMQMQKEGREHEMIRMDMGTSLKR